MFPLFTKVISLEFYLKKLKFQVSAIDPLKFQKSALLVLPSTSISFIFLCI